MRRKKTYQFYPLLFFLFLLYLYNSVSASDLISKNASPDACLPFLMPPDDVIFNARHKIFAHYFSRFPLSIDNKPWTKDYYSEQYLTESGERNKWLAQGGYLRSRPLPVTPSMKTNYVIENLKKEIKLAISRGISGFTFDILSLKDIQPGAYLPNMLKAVSEVDPRFKIVLMPDMSALGPDADNVITIIKSLYNSPELYRLSDGRIVVAPFLSESVPPAKWAAMKFKLDEEGYKIAFVPTFLSLKIRYVYKYNSVGDGFGTFGTPLPGQGLVIESNAKTSHDFGKFYMAGVSGQGYRPKGYIYWESQGSLAYRKSWEGAIKGKAEWIQLTTWNDFSESTQISPYTDLEGSSGTGYFNLTGYYSTWFITGQQPLITHDVLYYFYRKHPVNAAAPKAGRRTVSNSSFYPGMDLIELLGFLKEPGTLVISIGGKSYEKNVEQGVQSFTVPLDSGTPKFSLKRHGKTLIVFRGTTSIVGSSGIARGYSDLTYWSGSASEKGTCLSSIMGADSDQ